MLLISFILSCLFIILALLATILCSLGKNKLNYEMVSLGIKIAGLAVVTQTARIGFVVMTDSFEWVFLAVATLVFAVVNYWIWKYINLPRLEQYRKVSEEEQLAIDNEKIINELNDLYLNPAKVFDGKRNT